MKRIITIAAVLILAAALLLCGCGKKEEAPVPNVGFLAYESYILDYTIKEEQVQIRCVLSLVNQGTEACRIRVYAEFPEDVGALLKEGRLTAVTGATGEDIITLEPGTVRELGVVFTGEYGGKAVKNDRLLPDLYWEDMDNPGQVRTLQAYERKNNR